MGYFNCEECDKCKIWDGYRTTCLEECMKPLNALDEYKEYKRLEEQGLLPKFHLGDEFWTNWIGKPLKSKIVMIQQKKNGIWKYRFCDEQSHTHDYEENEFGKYFWTTKEEAEQALADMKGDSNG